MQNRDFDIPFIEEPYELGLDIDKLDFKRIKVETASYSGKLYDLEVENTKNYLTPFGFAHNGGGKRKGSILSDAVEAIMGAILKDQGIEFART